MGVENTDEGMLEGAEVPDVVVVAEVEDVLAEKTLLDPGAENTLDPGAEKTGFGVPVIELRGGGRKTGALLDEMARGWVVEALNV